MGSVIAERKLVCVDPDGSRTLVVIRLGAPYTSSDGDWACPVALEGLEARLVDIRGEDSFQALMLARRLALRLLLARADKGSRFVDADEEYDVNLSALFDGGL
jgi:hypothetical protein